MADVRWRLFFSVVLGNSIYERSDTGPPGFPIRPTQPARSWGERRVAGTRLRRKRCCHSNSLWLRDPHRPASEKWPLDESAVKQLVTVTELHVAAHFRRRNVRTDDEARPPLGSQRSARLLALAWGETRACPSVSPGACDSDDNSLRIFGGGETSRLH